MKFLVACLLCVGALNAEIISVSFHWNQSLCATSCVELTRKNLAKVRGVRQVEINGERGEATLKWLPNVPFDYYAVKRALQMVGIGPSSFAVKARGTFLKKGNNIVLQSLGDKTEFMLLSPVAEQSDRYNMRGTTANHQLQGPLLTQLKQGVDQSLIGEVAGTLFMPESPPNKLIVDSVRFEDGSK